MAIRLTFSKHALMATSALLSLGKPSEIFWNDYERLWNNSATRSPFKAPALLRYFADYTSEQVAVFQWKLDGELHGAVLLKVCNRVCTFLSDLKTDLNTFVFDRRCSTEEKQAFCHALLAALKEQGWSFEMNNQPLDSGYLPLLEAAARELDLGWVLVPHSVCPVLKAPTPAELEARMHKNPRYRYYANRLHTQQQATFEASTSADDLETWADAYCAAHIRRWANTPTPSAFQKAERRQFLLGCLRAWHQQGIAVRFSLRLSDGVSVAFAIGLLQPPALVFHATTFDPQYARYSPGKALIYDIAHWMSQNNLSVLDFGDGNEPYKYDTASAEYPLCRVFICQERHLACQVKARSFRFLKEHPAIEHLYRLKIKPLAAKFALLVHTLKELLEAALLSL